MVKNGPNGQKWSKMVKYGQKWSIMIKNGQNFTLSVAEIPCQAKIAYFDNDLLVDHAVPGCQVPVDDLGVGYRRQVGHAIGHLDSH